jgi:hypothetical protein
MNSEFLKHLQSITPQGMAAEKRLFIPADVIKKEVEDADELRKLDSIDELDEATRSKYLKIYGKHKVGSDESKMNLARLKRDMAMLQRGGADAETMKKAAAASGRFNRNEKPDPSYNPHDAAMAGYRFARKATRSFDAGKKSPRKAAVTEAAPDIGQNLKGMPRRSARKLAYALKKGGDRSMELDRHTRKMGSNARRWGNKLDSAMSDFSKRTGIPMKESSLGMRKGIRIAKAVYQKGHTNLGHRMDAGVLRSYSKTRAEVGLDPRINVIPPRYQPSDAEYAAMQGHAERRRKGINKKYGIDESAKRTYKRVKKTAKRLLKKIGRSLMQPSDAADIMFTGRNF